MARVSGRASPEPRARQQRRWLGATTVNAGAHRVAQAPQLLPPVAPLHGYILFPSDYKHGLCAVGRNLFVINQRQCERLLKTLCYWGVFFHGWKQDVAGVGARREGYYISLLTSEGALEDSGCPDSLASERW
uniref:Uncharacterized protein n=1 Tax=Aegilops tauschii subsp. strangulata TaxID=200361 RepID=A0A453R4J1_AEGTS